MKLKMYFAAIPAASLFFLTGCMDQTIAPKVEDNVEFQQQRYDEARFDNASFKRHAMPFVSGTSFMEPEPLPSFLRKSVAVTAARPLGLKYYVNKISAQIGKPVRVGQDIYSVDTIVTSQAQADNNSDGNVSDNSAVNELIVSSQNKQSPLAMQEQLKISGTAEQALNIVTSAFNVHWKYTNDSVTIYKLETRTFRLNLQTTDQITSSFDGSTTSGTEGGLKTTVSSELSPASFTAYTDTINSMLSPYGSAHLLGNTGAVVVTDTPEKLEAVEVFLEQENKTLTSQVAMDIEVIRLTSSDGSDVGVVWDELLADLGDISLKAISRQIPLGTSPSNELGASVNSGRLSGSKLILQALESKARVQVVTRETRKVLNNIPAVLRDISIIEYPSESTQSVSEGVTTVTTTKGTIRPGFDMSLTPRILEDNRVILQLVTTMSRDLPFDEISAGGSTTKFARLIQKEFKTTQVIDEGETAMITGYINRNLASTEDGVGKSEFWLLGGGQTTTNAKDMLIIFVTPHITRG